MRLLKNSIYILTGSGAPFVVALATVPLYIDQIGLARYGALSIAWLILGYFGSADFGMGRAVTQRIASLFDAGPAQRAQTVWSAYAGMTGISLATGLLVYVAAAAYFAGPFEVEDGLRAELLASVWALALAVPLMGFTGIAAGSLMGAERFKFVSLSSMAGNIGLQVFPLITAYLIGNNLLYLIVASLAARVVGFLVTSAGTWQVFLKGQPIVISKHELGYLTKFGAWVMVSALLGPMMIYADRFVIGAAMNAVAVAAYTIPFQIAYRTLIFPQALVNALFPRFASQTREGSLALCGIYAIFVGQFFAPLVIGLIALSGPLMQLWLGDDLDTRSIAIAQILMLGIWINAMAIVPFAQIQARGNSRFTAVLHLFELPLYVAVLYLLGSRLGLAGMATAFTLRCAVDCLCLFAKSRIGNGYVLRKLAGPAVLILLTLFLGYGQHEWSTALPLAVILTGLASLLAIFTMPPLIHDRLAMLPYLGRFVGLLRIGTAKPG